MNYPPLVHHSPVLAATDLLATGICQKTGQGIIGLFVAPLPPFLSSTSKAGLNQDPGDRLENAFLQIFAF